jgi:hypothetical protein
LYRQKKPSGINHPEAFFLTAELFPSGLSVRRLLPCQTQIEGLYRPEIRIIAVGSDNKMIGPAWLTPLLRDLLSPW